MSPRSIAEKLHIRPDTSVWPSQADRLDLVGPLPAGVRVSVRPDDAATILVFADDAATVRRVLDAHAAALRRADTVWVAYPKGNRTDVNRDTLWPILADYGLRPITKVAIDDTWSALRFRPLREGEAPFTGGR